MLAEAFTLVTNDLVNFARKNKVGVGYLRLFLT